MGENGREKMGKEKRRARQMRGRGRERESGQNFGAWLFHTYWNWWWAITRACDVFFFFRLLGCCCCFLFYKVVPNVTALFVSSIGSTMHTHTHFKTRKFWWHSNSCREDKKVCKIFWLLSFLLLFFTLCVLRLLLIIITIISYKSGGIRKQQHTTAALHP